MKISEVQIKENCRKVHGESGALVEAFRIIKEKYEFALTAKINKDKTFRVILEVDRDWGEVMKEYYKIVNEKGELKGVATVDSLNNNKFIDRITDKCHQYVKVDKKTFLIEKRTYQNKTHKIIH